LNSKKEDCKKEIEEMEAELIIKKQTYLKYIADIEAIKIKQEDEE